MKLLKFLILLFGATGLAMVLADTGALQAGFEHAPLHSGLIVLGWAAPVAMGVLAIVRPPLQAWQASAALAGFAVVAIRIRIWKALPSFGDAPIEGQIGLVVLICGLVTSGLAVAKPEGGA